MRYVILVCALVFAACQQVPPGPLPTFAPLWTAGTELGAQIHTAHAGFKGADVPLLTKLSAAHLTEARDTIQPYWVGKPGGPFNNAPYDDEYAKADALGIRMVFILAAPDSTTGDPIKYLADLTAFATGAAVRYPKARFEAENEPDNNVGFGLDPKDGVAAYLLQITPVLQAMRVANPKVFIVSGGTQTVNLPWQQALVDSGTIKSGLFNGVAVHLYGDWVNQPPGVTGGGAYAHLQSLKGILPIGTPVYITEYGVREPQALDVCGDSTHYGWFPVMQETGPAGFDWYEMADEPDAAFGLLNQDYTPKPAYTAVAADCK